MAVFFKVAAIETVLKMAAANGAAKVYLDQNGLLSKPAASHLTRLHQADGGLILPASHNLGGIDEDFGVKFNTANGGPAPEIVTDAIYGQPQTLSSYTILDAPEFDLSAIGQTAMGHMQIETVDPVVDYQALMETLFDFDKICALLASGFTMRFDAMHAVTGPYAKADRDYPCKLRTPISPSSRAFIANAAA